MESLDADEERRRVDSCVNRRSIDGIRKGAHRLVVVYRRLFSWHERVVGSYIGDTQKRFQIRGRPNLHMASYLKSASRITLLSLCL